MSNPRRSEPRRKNYRSQGDVSPRQHYGALAGASNERGVALYDSLIKCEWSLTMLTVTEAARARLLTKLDRKNATDDVAMRFTRVEKGWRLDLGQASPDDTVFAHEGRNVLLLDAAAAKIMDTMTLDVRNTEKGTRLKLRQLERKSE